MIMLIVILLIIMSIIIPLLGYTLMYHYQTYNCMMHASGAAPHSERIP